jgi:hypothetical protein
MHMGVKIDLHLLKDSKVASLQVKYSGTSVHEFNSFLEAVRHPKCS